MNPKPSSPAPFARIMAMTMTSREIAELVKSNHADVKRSIDRMASKGAIPTPPSAGYLDALGRTGQTEYLLDKRSSYIIVAQLSPEFTARLVDRWQELEQKTVQPPPASLSRIEILTLALESEKRAVDAEDQLKLAAPAIAHLNAVQSSKDDFTFQEMANILQEHGYRLGRNRLMGVLRRAGVLTKESNLPMQEYRERGYFRVVESIRKSSSGNTHVDLTTYVTGKGHNWLTKAIDTLLLKSEKMGGAT